MPSRGVEHGAAYGRSTLSEGTAGWLVARRDGLELTHVRAAVVAPGPVRMAGASEGSRRKGFEGEACFLSPLGVINYFNSAPFRLE